MTAMSPPKRSLAFPRCRAGSGPCSNRLNRQEQRSTNSDVHRPKARYAVFDCPACVGGMTAAGNARFAWRPNRMHAGDLGGAAWRRAALRVLWRWAAQSITEVGNAEPFASGQQPLL